LILDYHINQALPAYVTTAVEFTPTRHLMQTFTGHTR
jgi:hypothetical protein